MVCGVVAVLCILAVPGAQAQQDQPVYPVGSVSVQLTSVAAGIGGSWGAGVLIFQGQEYPIRMEGVAVGATVGISQINAVGNVYNLNSPADVAGTYLGISGGIAIAGGVQGTLARNQNGVVIDLTATQEGVSFNLGTTGFSISLQ